MRQTFDDRLRRSGGKCPPLPAWGGPSSRRLSFAAVEARRLMPDSQDAEADPADWWPNTPWWLRFADSLLLSIGCDGPIAIGWYGRRFRFPACGRRMHGER